MKNVDRVPELRYVHRSICAARVAGTYLPNGFIKAAQDLGALVPLPYLSLVQREPSLCRTARGNSVTRSNVSTNQTNLRGSLTFSGTTSIICQNWHERAE